MKKQLETILRSCRLPVSTEGEHSLGILPGFGFEFEWTYMAIVLYESQNNLKP